MKEDEDIATYFLWVDEIVNTMRGVGEKVENTTLVQKILRSLPIIFDSKVSALEERKYMDKVSMDELHGILTTYEMRIRKKSHPKRRQPSRFPRRQRKTTKIQNLSHALVVVKTRMMKKNATL